MCTRRLRELPTDHTAGRTVGGVDDPAMFLSPTQVDGLVDALPWPFNVYAHLAAWTGLRAAELCGLRVGDVLASDEVRVHRTLHVRVHDAAHDRGVGNLDDFQRAALYRLRRVYEVLLDVAVANPQGDGPVEVEVFSDAVPHMELCKRAVGCGSELTDELVVHQGLRWPVFAVSH